MIIIGRLPACQSSFRTLLQVVFPLAILVVSSCARNENSNNPVFGTALQRFLYWHKAGQSSYKEGDRETAMQAYAIAEGIRPRKSIPDSLLYELHMDKSIIYADAFDFSRAIEECSQALRYARKTRNHRKEFRALLNIATLYGNADDLFMQTQYLDSASILLGEASYNGVIDYYTGRAEWMQKMKRPAVQIEALMDSVQQVHPFGKSYPPTWIQLAWTYTRAGLLSKASSALDSIPDGQFSASAYAAYSELLDSLHRPQESLEAYRKYVHLSDSLDLVLFRQDTRFIEERHSSELRRRKARLTIIIILLASMSAMLFLFHQIQKKRALHKRTVSLYDDLKEEYEDLKQLSIKDGVVNRRAKILLGERLKALTAFFIEETPESLDRAYSRLESLTENRKELVETIGLLFGVYHPHFVSMLIDYKLSTTEVGFCCLYVLGFRTYEIGEVINRSAYYNISSDIRKKLPVQHMKLATWLNEKFQELS